MILQKVVLSLCLLHHQDKKAYRKWRCSSTNS